MISTQKLTSLAFALHDGLCKKEDNLSDDQKQQAIRYGTIETKCHSLLSLHFFAVKKSIIFSIALLNNSSLANI